MLRIAVNLEGESMKKFLEIKEYLGIGRSTDVFRFLIADFHRRKIEKKEHTA